MKFLFDQSADFRLIDHLQSLSHDVTAISRNYPHSLADEDVLAIARQEQRILVVADRDFGELIFTGPCPRRRVVFPASRGPAADEDRASDGSSMPIKYLSHEDFTYVIEASNQSDSDLMVTVRIFLCPEDSVDDRRAWIEMDKFRHSLGPKLLVSPCTGKAKLLPSSVIRF